MPRFDLERFLALIERVPRHGARGPAARSWPLLARHPMVDAYDLSSLELIVSGGAPLGADLQRAVAERFPHAAVGQGWGMTETTVGATMPDRELGTEPGSVGRVMPNTELRVVEPGTGSGSRGRRAGRAVGQGTAGDGRLPEPSRGHRRHPRRRGVADAPATSGYVDRDGNVFIVDRLKELIKVSAYQVAPAELEAILLTHPQVADAAVDPPPGREAR